MSMSAIFIHRPIATTLLAFGLAIAGAIAFNLLPIAPVPQVDFPTISVTATLPGGSPENMATSVASPLERQLGRISGITQMISSSTLGITRITLQFALSRDIDGAARDVQSAINAARSQLPPNLPNNPTYRKINPADSPVIILALTSDKFTKGQLYDVASSILQQKLSQVRGVGQVIVGGSSLPAVRIELNPTALTSYGIGLPAVAAAIKTANMNLPKGQISVGDAATSAIMTNDQLFKPYQYAPLIIAYQNNSPVRISDVGEVIESVEDLRNAGLSNTKPAVLLVIFKQPGANVISTAEQVKATLPQLKASIPAAIDMEVVLDRTTTIRASLHDVEITLVIAMILVILVTYCFLGSMRAMIIPGVAVPLSLLGTFAFMKLLGYSLDNLSLMALTIHRDINESFLDSRFHSYSFNGWSCWALVSRICCYLIGSHPHFNDSLSNGNPHDVFAALERYEREKNQPLYQCSRTLTTALSKKFGLVIKTHQDDVISNGRHGLNEYHYVYFRA